MFKRVLFALTLFFFIQSVTLAQTKGVELDSFYPSPYGAFEMIKMDPLDKTLLVCDISQVGMIIMDELDDGVQMCVDSSGGPIWRRIGGMWTELHRPRKKQSTIMRHAVSVNEPGLRVGVNTEDPRETFDVNGTLMTARFQSNIKRWYSSGSGPVHKITSFEANWIDNGVYNSLAPRLIGWEWLGTTTGEYFTRTQIDGKTVLLNSRDSLSSAFSNPVTNTRGVGIGVYDTRSMLHVREKVEATEYRGREGNDGKYAFMSAQNVTGSTNDYVEFGARFGFASPGPYMPVTFEASEIALFEPSATPIAPFVGIGVTGPHADPSVKLQINGKVMAERALMKKQALGEKIDIFSNSSLNIAAMNNSVIYGFLRIDGGNILLQNASGGSVGIGMIPDSAYKLDVNGPVRATSHQHPSDFRYKKNIKTIDNPVKKISKIKGLFFYWKDGIFGNKRQVGVIAQDVNRVFPEVVDKARYMTVSYDKLVGPIIESIKELDLESEEIERRIEALERKNEEVILCHSNSNNCS